MQKAKKAKRPPCILWGKRESERARERERKRRSLKA